MNKIHMLICLEFYILTKCALPHPGTLAPRTPDLCKHLWPPLGPNTGTLEPPQGSTQITPQRTNYTSLVRVSSEVRTCKSSLRATVQIFETIKPIFRHIYSLRNDKSKKYTLETKKNNNRPNTIKQIYNRHCHMNDISQEISYDVVREQYTEVQTETLYNTGN